MTLPVSLSVSEAPYPHIIAENIFDEALLANIDAHWPEQSFFTPTGVVGDGTCNFIEKLHLLNPASQLFWSSFALDTLFPLQKRIYEQFAPYCHAKYGPLLLTAHFSVVLMEALPEFVDHPVHNHHYHDPTWLFTNLIYIDGGTKNTRGTALFATGDTDYNALARISAQTLQWEDMPDMQPVKEAPCIRNSMLAFLDSPISYHGVLPSEHTLERKRRLIRCHASAPRDLIPQLYGMPISQYEFHRRRASKSPIVIDMLEKEIATLKSIRPNESPPGPMPHYTMDKVFKV